MPGQGLKDGLAVARHARHVFQVAGREPAAHVDHLQLDAAQRHFPEDACRHGESEIPGFEIGLLGADVEGDAIGLEAEPVGMFQDVRRHVRVASEFARQRPFGTDTVAQDPAEDFRAGSDTADFFNFFDAVDGKEPDAKVKGTRNVPLLLDGVAVGNTICRSAGASTISISPTDAQSKHEPRLSSSDRISGAGLAFTA